MPISVVPKFWPTGLDVSAATAIDTPSCQVPVCELNSKVI